MSENLVGSHQVPGPDTAMETRAHLTMFGTAGGE
jgi:hypothetical protein